MTDNTTTPVNQIPLIAGNLQTGDVLVGERISGTTVRISVGSLSGAVNSVNGHTGTVVLTPDDLSDTSTIHKFTSIADISRLASTSGTNTGDQTITLTGGVTGSGTGSFAATVVTNANLTGPITSVGNTTSVASQTGIGSKFVMDTSPTLVTPVLGTPSSGTLTNCTGLPVAGGGTGVSSVTAYAPLVGGTSSTNALQSTASGSTGQVLQSAGNAAVPTWSTPTYPSASGTTGKFIISDGTNNGYSTSTIPTSAGATSLKHLRSDGTNYVLTTATISDSPSISGKILISDGTNWITSTPTFPNASATLGKRITSDGTNWVASTTTMPDTGTNRKILVGNGTNYVESTETWAVPGSSGNVLRSDGTNWTAAKATLTTDVTGILPVANGGTGVATMTTAYAPVVAGTTATGALQVASTGLSSTGFPLISAGSSAVPTFRQPVRIMVHLSANQTGIVTATLTKLQLNLKDIDSDTYYDAVTNYRFTPLIAGDYFIACQATWATNVFAGGVYQIYIRKNGSSYLSFGSASTSIATTINSSTMSTINFNGSTDYIEIIVFQNSGSNATVYGGNFGTYDSFITAVLL